MKNGWESAWEEEMREEGDGSSRRERRWLEADEKQGEWSGGVVESVSIWCILSSSLSQLNGCLPESIINRMIPTE